MLTRYHYAIGAGALILAFAAGRYTARQPDVRAEEKVRVETVEVFSDRQEWVTARETETTTAEVRVAYRHRKTDPSGASEETSLDVSGSASQVKEATQAAGARETEAARVERVFVDRKVEVRTPLPDWRVGVGGNISPAGWSAGPEVDWRIAGPLSLRARLGFGSEISGGAALVLDM